MQNIETERERLLWKEAKKRVEFKNHLYTYLIVNLICWVLWLIGEDRSHRSLPWPVFCTLGWGFGLFWHYMSVYVMRTRSSQVEKEFERLKKEQGL